METFRPIPDAEPLSRSQRFGSSGPIRIARCPRRQADSQGAARRPEENPNQAGESRFQRSGRARLLTRGLARWGLDAGGLTSGRAEDPPRKLQAGKPNRLDRQPFGPARSRERDGRGEERFCGTRRSGHHRSRRRERSPRAGGPVTAGCERGTAGERGDRSPKCSLKTNLSHRGMLPAERQTAAAGMGRGPLQSERQQRPGEQNRPAS